MKKIIVTSKQAKYLTEDNAANIAVQSKDNTTNGFINAATNSKTTAYINNASRVAPDVNLIVSGPNSNDSQPQQVVNVANGDTIQNAISQQANDDLIKNGGSVKVMGNSLGEAKMFTKKTIEEARLKKLRENTISYSKKDLFKNLK